MADFEEPSAFMRIPSEIRLMIYDLLLDDGGNRTFQIRSQDVMEYKKGGVHVRTSYRVLNGTLLRQSQPTTYRMVTPCNLETSILCVNRKVHEEASCLLYGTHSFDFGDNIEAIVPFLSDLSPATRPFLQELCFVKQGAVYSREFDRSEWKNVCEFIATHLQLRRLHLTVVGGKPLSGWEGIEEYSARDFKLLCGFEGMEWVQQLLAIRGLEHLEVVPEIEHCPPSRSRLMAFFTAFSASIDKGFAQFLKAEMISL